MTPVRILSNYPMQITDCGTSMPWTIPKNMTERRSSSVALVYNPDKMKKGVFVPGRFAMTCCVEDITFIGFKCKYPDSDKIPHKSWIEITAKVQSGICKRVSWKRTGRFIR